MWYAYIAFVPEQDLGIVVVTNGSMAGAEVVEGVARRLYSEWTTKPASP